MNNPFGLPDEVMASIINAVIKQNKPSEDVNAREAAKTIKSMYDAFIEVGFIEPEAFELLKLFIQMSINKRM